MLAFASATSSEPSLTTLCSLPRWAMASKVTEGMAASTPSMPSTRATSSSEKPKVEMSRRSHTPVPSYQASPAARMSGPHICKPA